MDKGKVAIEILEYLKTGEECMEFTKCASPGCTHFAIWRAVNQPWDALRNWCDDHLPYRGASCCNVYDEKLTGLLREYNANG